MRQCNSCEKQRSVEAVHSEVEAMNRVAEQHVVLYRLGKVKRSGV